MLIIAFIIIQLVSLAVMLLFVHEYKRIAHKHEDLVHTIEAGVKPCCTLHSSIIIWLYVILMSSIIIGTTGIFLSKIKFL